jgi:hypothetical protein
LLFKGYFQRRNNDNKAKRMGTTAKSNLMDKKVPED